MNTSLIAYIWVLRWPLDDWWSSSEQRSTQNHGLHGARRNISACVVTFKHFMGAFSCVLIEILIRVQACDSGAYNGPFRKRYIDHWEESLMMEPRSAETCRRSYFNTRSMHHLFFITTN
jgi:hypothetical protein